MENMEEHTLSCLQYRHCFLGLLIAAMSITVISNIFSGVWYFKNVLVQQADRQRQVLSYESLWQSDSHPLGLIAGTYLVILVWPGSTGHLFPIINDAAKIIMRPFTFSCPFIYLCGHICLQVYFRFALLIILCIQTS